MSNHIFFQGDAVEKLNNIILSKQFSKIFVLVDENTHEHCFQNFISSIVFDKIIEVIEIESGEINKNINTVVDLWQILSDYHADRYALLINLGGGVITDMGGFVGSTYKRGIDFVHVPTTLLAMVDAAIGGKNGIDLGYLKNQIGTINQPLMVSILPEFLNTLPKREWRSGLAEMLKHGLIYDKNHWLKIAKMDELEADDLSTLIKESAEIKSNIILQDINELGLRKILNFGHTLGHAIESYTLETNEIDDLLHGEAVALGMILEAHLSWQKKYINRETYEHIKSILMTFYDMPSFELTYDLLENYMLNDKKNRDGQIKFVLLKQIGEAIFDEVVDKDMILSCLSELKK